MLGVLNQIVNEHFTVTNDYGELVPGVSLSEFIPRIYNSDGNDVTGTISDNFVELGNGHYKYQFTPNTVGTWFITISHPIYFPHGKEDDIQVYEGDLTVIYESVRKTLGLVHHNFYIDNPTYDNSGNLITARLRIYTNASSVGSNSNVLETYRIESDGGEPGKFTYWSQVVVP